jgi:hypothetical protein
MSRTSLILVSLIVSLLLTLPSEVAASDRLPEHHEGEPIHKNAVELFLGNSHTEHHDGFSVGVIYEYRFPGTIAGIGGLAEYAAGDFKHWILGVPLFAHPYAGWRFVLAPGVELRENDEAHGEEQNSEHGENKNELLLRLGVGYEFEMNKWSITPEINFDFVEHENVLVYGISFGRKF